ncbi:CAMK family protein kinase [Tritrichomonas foetus]|uniref:CAMK family protein kinase n=1 Tax=Tritrichomonas foetus TaxID=1144522 RepID=A0A1J4L5S1_9EUKA|nr:CAMK family protein kinase [Tritrichomonas foetus]|eukprot:OHT17293.1 CAMK family protein kinase [Tritrichomonas foetus]
MFEKSMEYLAPLHTVGNYRLVEYISPCQNGDVFIAVSKRDKTQKYVLKILRRKEFTENGMFKMLERESRIQGFMKSDKIVRSYETIYTDEYIVLVLEYCANGDLISYLKKQMNLPFIEKVRILANLAEALEYMHNRNVVHRDIKLDNIFMDANNNAKLGDFGCCEITTENISHYYDACGTLHYTAPEILNSKLSKVDITKCDIWSFGIVAFTLLTNR